jgi:Tfp pilus assembly protein PilF
MAGRGQVDAAIAHYQKALESKPDDSEAHNNLGAALASRGQVDAAIAILKGPWKSNLIMAKRSSTWVSPLPAAAEFARPLNMATKPYA